MKSHVIFPLDLVLASAFVVIVAVGGVVNAAYSVYQIDNMVDAVRQHRSARDAQIAAIASPVVRMSALAIDNDVRQCARLARIEEVLPLRRLFSSPATSEEITSAISELESQCLERTIADLTLADPRRYQEYVSLASAAGIPLRLNVDRL